MDPNTRALLMGASGGATEKIYVEDVFSTWLYTGNGIGQTIINGIDLSGKGGMVWFKARNQVISSAIVDTARGASVFMRSDQTGGNDSSLVFDSFNSNGFSLLAGGNTNGNNYSMASWTFRKAAKFFDVVSYVGNGSNRTIAHNLGSVPGCIIVKRTDTAADWQVYHRSLANTEYLVLNSTAASATGTTRWNSTTPTSTAFSLGTDSTVNANGGTYVAYLFAHDAGGFGDSGNESVIKCGIYTGNGSNSGPFVDLGWEPQWVMIKSTASYNPAWTIYDNMRGVPVGGTDQVLLANSATSESTYSNQDWLDFNQTGFTLKTSNGGVNDTSVTYIYIAIRRGPMKTPTDATKVFSLLARTGTGGTATITGVGFPPDMVLVGDRDGAAAGGGQLVADRLRGPRIRLTTASFNAEIAASTQIQSFDIDGFTLGSDSSAHVNGSPWTYINNFFRRAPGFFDVVCYSGTGSARTVSHNLGVAPELMIIKGRGPNQWNWIVYHAAIGATKYLRLNLTNAQATDTMFNNTAPTASVFSIDLNSTNSSSDTYIAYLFASCPGVSKCFNYTGTGTTKQIDCGFTNGARFVMIKRTDSTGDWYVWDTARGIISGNDPYLLLNSTAAEVTNTDYIDPYSAGFEISSTAPAAINANGGSYIGLAIA